jgi:hypothetical protein
MRRNASTRFSIGASCAGSSSRISRPAGRRCAW